MAYLKEDGSLDVERINKLPIDEFVKEYRNFNTKQLDEYWMRTQLNESQGPTRAIEIDSYIANNGVDAIEFLNKMRQKYEQRI